jgi:dihydrofolate reductase
MKSIVAVDQNWAIGREGKLLAHLPGDLKYFREKTLNKVVVMGRATLESLPNGKPLPDRVNIVLSTNPDFMADCIVCRSLEELFQILKKYDKDDIFVIGGEKVYKQLLPYCDSVFVTKIHASFPADKYFVNLDKHTGWELIGILKPCSEKGITYQHTEYRRKEAKGE